MRLPEELEQNLETDPPLIFPILSVWSHKPVRKKEIN